MQDDGNENSQDPLEKPFKMVMSQSSGSIVETIVAEFALVTKKKEHFNGGMVKRVSSSPLSKHQRAKSNPPIRKQGGSERVYLRVEELKLR